ncbi:hypothetical protein M0R45_022039 [Rubus argutus]|uniref:Uncharacterized protein n=1 Tax=Rubus argutus TaxID=59490 RepID=A0AAW1XD95_RUBAR
MRFFGFCTTLILGSSSTSKDRNGDDEDDKMKELIAKSLEDKPPQAMSVVELDPSECRASTSPMIMITSKRIVRTKMVKLVWTRRKGRGKFWYQSPHCPKGRGQTFVPRSFVILEKQGERRGAMREEECSI